MGREAPPTPKQAAALADLLRSHQQLADTSEMDTSPPSISTCLCPDNESFGLPLNHAYSLELFRDRVIRPSLKALDNEINAQRGKNEPSADFFAEDLGELFQKSVEGYLLTIQSMLERGIRGMLILRDNKLCNGENVAKLERARWGEASQDLQGHFKRLMEIPLDSFDMYADLDVLQNLGNAIRHGDGNSARRLYEKCPSLWPIWLPPGVEVDVGPFRFTNDGPSHPEFSSITLPEEVLEQMIQSVLWFWEDIENIRCSSFRTEDTAVAQHIASLNEKRAHRVRQRTWRPS